MRKNGALARFFDRIVVGDNGCWLWCGPVFENGYGVFYWNGRLSRVHRFAYEMWNGPLIDGLQIHHTCEAKRCANPDHLEQVTPRENVMASDTPARRNARKTHCKHGHEFTPETTWVSAKGERRCQPCIARRTREWKARRAESSH